MIKVNLLIKPKPTNWRRVGLYVAAGSVVMLVAFYLIWWMAEYRALAQEERALADLASSYEAVLGRETELRKELESYETTSSVIAALSRNQTEPQSRTFAAILQTVPADVTLTSVALRADGSVEIVGSGKTSAVALPFLASLGKLAVLTEGRERGITFHPTGEVSFTYTAKVRRGEQP